MLRGFRSRLFLRRVMAMVPVIRPCVMHRPVKMEMRLSRMPSMFLRTSPFVQMRRSNQHLPHKQEDNQSD